MHSQTTSIKEPRVQTIVNVKGDTLIQMHLSDAKIILADVLDREVLDSIIDVYKQRDSINDSTIQLQVKEIRLLNEKSLNQVAQNDNLNKIIELKNAEIAELNKTIVIQKKEIKKQKFYKVLTFIAAVVLPITVLTLK